LKIWVLFGLEEITYRTRWWGLPISDPTMMRTEITLRSNTFAADGYCPSPSMYFLSKKSPHVLQHSFSLGSF
jgi:hypothetical protein